jgi:hypothetical protein
VRAASVASAAGRRLGAPRTVLERAPAT